MNKKITLKDTVGLPIIESAGGLICNQDHYILLIFKRGKWDLPKGRTEGGDDTMITAIRESSEETGLKENKLKIIGKLVSTYHTTSHNKKDFLKKTHWYWLDYKGHSDDVKPQIKEGIVECRWVHLSDLPSYLINMHPRIYYVIQFWQKNLAYVART
ncbi:MAG: hypothetical protein DRQ51_09535 [Gammaproteobacteria bacterium]|nr:MAG: hypothetical protein DRQ51_09535 [Gammaproteobacteria bacterium]